MKALLAILLFTFNVFMAKADYGYLRLCEMIQKADYGVVGTIIKIDINYFYLKVDSFILNEFIKDTLPIVKYENWNCGRRFAEYKVGQKEVVFFRKSNYIIDDYELLGYGGGNEYEMLIEDDSIQYQSNYGHVISYNLNVFLNAVSDYNKLFKNKNEHRSTISQRDKISFIKKSTLHKKLIECEVHFQNQDYKTLVNNKGIRKGSEPILHFPNQKGDTMHYRFTKDAVPRVSYYLKGKIVDQSSEFKLLSYEYQIISNNKIETFKVKSEYGTREFRDRLKYLKTGDRITVSNIYALSPEKKLIRVHTKSVIVSTD